MTTRDGFRSKEGGLAAPPYTHGPYTFSEDITFNGNTSIMPERKVLVENFKQLPSLNASIGVSTNLDFEILGTNASADDVTYDATNAGILLTTDGADNDQIIILPHLDTNQTAWTGTKWGTENQVIWEAAIKTGASVATVLIWAGLKLTNTPTIATDDDQVFFRFSTDDTNTTWRCISSVGGVDTNTNSAVTVAADTQYYFKIEIDSDRKANFYINGDRVHRTGALTNDVDLIPYIGVQSLSAAADTLIVNYEKISRILFE